MTEPYRDEQLGAALSALDVPEHRLDFEARLRRRLRAERPRRRRRPVVVWGGRIAAVAALAAVVVLTVDVLRPGDEPVPRIGVQPATAAEVKARVRAALTAAETMSGRLVFLSVNPLTGERERREWRFAMTAAGDFRGERIGGVGDVAYDSATGVERSLNTSASMGEGLFAAERTGLAPGPPDPGPSDDLLRRDLGSVVRALLAAKDPRVAETVHHGRQAWRLDVAVRPNQLYADADRLEITVDRATGIPVRVVETLGGEFRRELRVENLAVDEPLPSGRFRVDFPEGVEVLRTDGGFRRVALRQVASIVGYAPLVPAWVPRGYELREVAVAERSTPTGSEGANPPSEMVVSLAYRRGLDRFVVTTRLARGATWADPLATREGFVDEPERIEVRAGALAGASAELLVVPRRVPHVWAQAEELVVTVGGDLGRAELVRILEALRQRR